MPDVIELEFEAPPVLELRLLRAPEELPADMGLLIAGQPGPPGGASYTHTQAIALPIWTVPHNLARFPSVTVTDHLGRVVYPDVEYLDNNIVQIAHGAPLTGFAYCN